MPQKSKILLVSAKKENLFCSMFNYLFCFPLEKVVGDSLPMTVSLSRLNEKWVSYGHNQTSYTDHDYCRVLNLHIFVALYQKKQKLDIKFTLWKNF